MYVVSFDTQRVEMEISQQQRLSLVIVDLLKACHVIHNPFSEDGPWNSIPTWFQFVQYIVNFSQGSSIICSVMQCYAVLCSAIRQPVY